MKSAFALAILAATLVTGVRHNDWAKPCFDGECAYDLPDHKGQTGAVKFFASSPNAIADITPAAGWVILDCDPNALSQDIRLVCKSDDAEGTGCKHFFEGAGPVDKYVRLPESCSSSPFARISKFWVHDDQSVPSHHQVTRRDGVVPQVYAVSIDDKFDQIDTSKHGDVHFAAYGATLPGLDINLAFPDDIATPSSADAFLNEAVQALEDASFKFTRISAHVQEVYVVKPDSHPPPINLPKPTKDEKATTPKPEHFKFGNENDAWATNEIKSEDLQCKVGSFSGGLAITGTINHYFWGESDFGGATVGSGGKIKKFLGFFSGLEAHVKHEIGLSISLTGKASIVDKEFGPWEIPHVTALEFGVARIGLWGAVKVEANINAEVAAEFKTEVQYGIHKGVVKIPGGSVPKETYKTEPYFNPGSFDVKVAPGVEGKVKAGAEFILTPKLVLGTAAAGSNTANAYAGLEAKIAFEVEGSTAKKRDVLTSDADDSFADAFCATAKINIDGIVGGELKFLGLGPAIKHSFLKSGDLKLGEWGPACSKKARRAMTMIRKRSHPNKISLDKKGLQCPKKALSEALNIVKNAVIDPTKIKGK